jgi:ferredoxin-NADP reductase
MAQEQKCDDPTINVTVVAKYPASDSVVALHLAATAGNQLPNWEPGAHVDFVLPNGLTRQYSLCGDPDERSYWRFGVLGEQNSRGGSAFVHQALREGDTLRLNGPRNRFPLLAAKRYRFIAGGIGITPLLPMVRAVANRGDPWQFLYGGRTLASMAFVEELSGLGEHVLLQPQDRFGLLDLPEFLSDLKRDDAVYCCGPELLIRAVEKLVGENSEAQLHTERFANASPIGKSGTSFSVRLTRSGKTIEVAGGESILDALERAGLKPVFSCREGTCGTCETRVIAGRPEHRDSVLSDGEKTNGKSMMICISRSLDELLELDL